MRESVKRERFSVEIVADIHEIEGGGYWAEVPRLPGCVAQAESMETLKQNLIQAVDDWLNGVPVRTEDEARQLAELQGRSTPIEESFPQPNPYLPPASWTDEDE